MRALIFVFTGVVLVLVLQTVILWRAARWVRARRTSLRAAIFTILVMVLFNVPTAILSYAAINNLVEGGIANGAIIVIASIGLMLAGLAIPIVIVKLGMRTTFPRAALLYGLIFVPGLALIFLQPLVVEGFTVPTNSMAPTLVGPHHVATCPECGATLRVPATKFSSGRIPGMGICDRYHVVQFGDPRQVNLSEELAAADRFSVDKTQSPQRWDLTVFRHPKDPSALHVKRLVGLPGEEISIREDGIWIDGKRHSPPAELSGLDYSEREANYATADRPLKLKNDECFMLGDFPPNSSDSRYWGPLKQSEIIGVVTVRYSPFSRFEIFR